MILGADGKPVASERRVGLQITILDQQPGRSGFEKATMSFELDSSDPAMLSQLLQNISRSIVRRLDEIGFLEPEEPPVGYDKRRMDGPMNRDINHSAEPEPTKYHRQRLDGAMLSNKVEIAKLARLASAEPGGDDPEVGKGNE